MKNQFFKILGLIALALAGGFGGGQLAFSYLVGDFSMLGDNVPQGPVLVAQKQEIVVRENEAIVEAIAKVSGIAIQVEVTAANGKISRGSGIIITSDGLAAVPYSLYPLGSQAVITANGQKVSYEVLKRDKSADITILKLGSSNWPTAGFASAEGIKLGQRVFMTGTISEAANFANEGIVRSISPDLIGTNIVEAPLAAGSPLFDIEGNIIGMSLVDNAGFVSAIPVAKIKELSGL